MPEARQERVRLLVSACDPGAAHHMCEVVRYGREKGVLEPTLLAGPPALEIFKRAGFTVRSFGSGRTEQTDSYSVPAILDEAAYHIENIKPDAILVGLSGPDRGVDEALIARSGAIPTYAIQDFWGDVNPGFGKLPETYFVLDEAAADLTRLRAASSRIVVTGSARHAAMAKLDTMKLRAAFRSRTDAASPGLIAVFFGQPQWKLPGYGLTLSKTARALARVSPGATLLYRPHPKESHSDRRKALDCLAVPELSVLVDDAPVVEQSLCGADLAFTCFSSCGLDLAHLNRVSAVPLSPILFIMCEGDVQRHLREIHRIEEMPISTLGLAATVWHDAALDNAIRVALTQGERERIWRSAREKIADSSSAAERTASTIVEDVSNRGSGSRNQG